MFYVKDKDYCERLKMLNMYSVQRRVERYQILYIWNSVENGNRFSLSFSNPESRTGRKIQINRNESANSPLLRMKKLFNVLPKELRNSTGISLMSFKNALDKWLLRVPDEPNVPDYWKFITADSNSLIHQITYIRRWAYHGLAFLREAKQLIRTNQDFYFEKFSPL